MAGGGEFHGDRCAAQGAAADDRVAFIPRMAGKGRICASIPDIHSATGDGVPGVPQGAAPKDPHFRQV